jgi:hypothetical protein
MATLTNRALSLIDHSSKGGREREKGEVDNLKVWVNSINRQREVERGKKKGNMRTKKKGKKVHGEK